MNRLSAAAVLTFLDLISIIGGVVGVSFLSLAYRHFFPMKPRIRMRPQGSSSHRPFDTQLLSGMKWRTVGPYRGGRTRACAGVPNQPNVFYIGAVNGGVWKTDD